MAKVIDDLDKEVGRNVSQRVRGALRSGTAVEPSKFEYPGKPLDDRDEAEHKDNDDRGATAMRRGVVQQVAHLCLNLSRIIEHSAFTIHSPTGFEPPGSR